MIKADEICFSIVICTHNRAEILQDAVLSACSQSYNVQKYEIIVVDNNSTDDTKKLIANLQDKYPKIRYIFEKDQGLSNARNRGWREARGKYVGYIDDDCKVPREWLGNCRTKYIRSPTRGYRWTYFPLLSGAIRLAG
jgi:glucosyl-dolichyl phosphate glucuronosyltransferase